MLGFVTRSRLGPFGGSGSLPQHRGTITHGIEFGQCDEPELAAGTGARRVGRALSLSTAAGGRAL